MQTSTVKLQNVATRERRKHNELSPLEAAHRYKLDITLQGKPGASTKAKGNVVVPSGATVSDEDKQLQTARQMRDLSKASNPRKVKLLIAANSCIFTSMHF